MSTEVSGKVPLDMMQYKNILGTYREPRLGLDKLFYNRDSRHIVVAYQGNFYRVDVYKDNEQLRTEQILKQLHGIVRDTQRKGRRSQVRIIQRLENHGLESVQRFTISV